MERKRTEKLLAEAEEKAEQEERARAAAEARLNAAKEAALSFQLQLRRAAEVITSSGLVPLFLALNTSRYLA